MRVAGDEVEADVCVDGSVGAGVLDGFAEAAVETDGLGWEDWINAAVVIDGPGA